MIDRIAELVLDEGKWLPTAMFLAAVVVAARFPSLRRRVPSRRLGILWAMNLFYACMLGTMAFGHLLAVSVKVARGSLEGSPWLLYLLGLVLLIPAAWLAAGVGRYVEGEQRWRKRMLGLNAWLGVALLGLGIHNLPLALPAALNIGYQLHSRRAVGWTIVTVTVVGNLALFVGALIFMASGQTFEDFSGM